MNTKLNNTIPLSVLKKEITASEREFIEAEKKYYQLVVALKKKREQIGITQEELATRAKLPRTTITKVESGNRNATLQTILMMAKAMGSNLQFKLT